MRLRVYVLPLVLLVPLAACGGPAIPKSGNPSRELEASCIYAFVLRGDYQGVDWCRAQAAQRAARLVVAAPPQQARQPADASQPIAIAAQRLDISSGVYENGQVLTISLAGPIAPGDAARFITAFHNEAASHPAATRVGVVLNSPGGSIDEANLIAQDISNLELSTIVQGSDICASACFLIFAAGKQKLTSPTAQIGVHSVIDMRSDTETDAAKAVTTDLARLCAQYGVPPSIIGRMVTTPPRGVSWLNETELTEMGVQIVL